MSSSQYSETERASEERYVTRPIEAEVMDFVVGLGLVLGLIGGGVWGMVAPWVTDVTLWWPTLLGVIGVLFGVFLATIVAGEYGGRAEIAGFVGRKYHDDEGEGPSPYYITVSGTEFRVDKNLYDWVPENRLVTLKVRGGLDHGTVIAIRRGRSPTAQKPGIGTGEGQRSARESAQPLRRQLIGEAWRLHAELTSLGMDSQVLERGPAPEDEEALLGWVEISQGPIRWVVVSDDELDFHTCWLAPDPRIGVDTPFIRIHPTPIKSRPFFGREIGVRWIQYNAEYQPIGWTQHVADILNHDATVTQRMVVSEPYSLHVQTDPGRGCWAILSDNEDTKWTRTLLEYYQAIAEALLAMPLPTEE